jgi:hypothetical protein
VGRLDRRRRVCRAGRRPPAAPAPLSGGSEFGRPRFSSSGMAAWVPSAGSSLPLSPGHGSERHVTVPAEAAVAGLRGGRVVHYRASRAASWRAMVSTFSASGSWSRRIRGSGPITRCGRTSSIPRSAPTACRARRSGFRAPSASRSAGRRNWASTPRRSSRACSGLAPLRSGGCTTPGRPLSLRPVR